VIEVSSIVVVCTLQERSPQYCPSTVAVSPGKDLQADSHFSRRIALTAFGGKELAGLLTASGPSEDKSRRVKVSRHKFI
jgi:hypothetical protein